MPHPKLACRVRLLVCTFTIGACAAANAAEPLDFSAYRLSPDVKVLPAAPEPARAQSPATNQEYKVSARLAGMPFAKLIEGAAREASLDPALVHAVIAVESGYNPAARSPKGALGLMQVLPETALRYGIR
ncbi:MAG TPA: transglycosylase SLT domain-containing protein, partial [Burkholderiales bacterium]|nr:transglycosylase SLT domain-containing protein [Burkholderiales bacterium]